MWRYSMSKKEIRDQLRKECIVAGDVDFEMEQLRKVQNSGGGNDVLTLTVTCSNIFTLVCCE